jgi:hypothetical protein
MAAAGARARAGIRRWARATPARARAPRARAPARARARRAAARTDIEDAFEAAIDIRAIEALGHRAIDAAIGMFFDGGCTDVYSGCTDFMTSDRISLAATMEREGERERERDMAVDELHTWDVEGDTARRAAQLHFLTREAR